MLIQTQYYNYPFIFSNMLMAHQDIEIEIKLPLNNPEEVKQFLNKQGKIISKDVFQKDSYFVPAHRDLLKVEYPFEWLRLRESAKGFSLNYKHFHPENVKVTDYCDELETKIENMEAMKKIFQSLDMKETVVVEKVRTTYLFEEVEIAIDEVKDLGSYIELEITTHFPTPQEGKSFLYQVLEKL
jgi:adenylate cyclase, class 2